MKSIKYQSHYLRSYLIGLTASLINPKVIIFFSAIFSQFLNEDYSSHTKLGMALLAGIIDAFWYILASFSITFSIIQNYIKNKQKSIFIICGSILIFLSFYTNIQTLINLL